MKKVLLFTGKFPAFGEDTDGGSILIYSIIQALRDACILDVVFTRTARKEYETIAGVHRVMYETYKIHSDDKFERRLANRQQLLLRLQSLIPNYDTVIITHCSKAFGIETLPEDMKKKIIVFPMYLSPSYKRSGEYPPEEYEKEERCALLSAAKIITPSNSEKQDMITQYGIDGEKIKVIPRGYSSLIKPNIKSVSSPVHLLYIASIKEQKNTAEAILILNELLREGKDAVLHLVGSYQDGVVLDECKQIISLHALENHVIFHGVLCQKELAQLIESVHINISVSNWETFGRGIFEGMAGGVPTVVYSRLVCVAQYVNDGMGIRFVPNRQAFVAALHTLCENPQYYHEQAVFACQSVAYLSDQCEKEKLLRELL